MRGAGTGLRRWVLGATMLLGLAAIGGTGCGDDAGGTGGAGGAICDGGVFDEDGNCVEKCDPAACPDGSTCVDNACRFLCDRHPECYPGTQACVDRLEDDTGRLVNVCLDVGTLATPVGGFPQGTFGTSCFFGAGDCAAQFACPNGLTCDFTGAQCADCTLAEDLCPDAEHCNVGRCGDGSLCVVNTCAAEQCTPFVCLRDELGDGDAYCSHHDCTADADCPAGFVCGESRQPHEICGTDKGNNNLCGETTEGCVDPGQFEANGATLFEGAYCLLRNTCQIAEPCARCDHNLDCSWGDGQVCTRHAEQAVCAGLCGSDADCLRDETCVPYFPAALDGERPGFCQGAAGAPCALNADCESGTCLPIVGTCGQSPRFDCAQDGDCPVAGDSCVGRSVCVPRSGACDSSDAGDDLFCRHCTVDSDCGGLGSTYACGDFATGKACYDASFSTPCTVDMDCPMSPSGRHGECLDEGDGVQPSNDVYLTCYVPFIDPMVGYGCW